MVINPLLDIESGTSQRQRLANGSCTVEAPSYCFYKAFACPILVPCKCPGPGVLASFRDVGLSMVRSRTGRLQNVAVKVSRHYLSPRARMQPH